MDRPATAAATGTHVSAHTLMMAQYLGVTFSAFSEKACTLVLLGSVPS